MQYIADYYSIDHNKSRYVIIKRTPFKQKANVELLSLDYFYYNLTLISLTETRNKQREENQTLFLSYDLGPPPPPRPCQRVHCKSANILYQKFETNIARNEKDLVCRCV
jgi:hypothetical protein